jgi:MIP family channel proteins
MDSNLQRGLVAEALGTFAVVYFGAAAVCVNYLSTTGAAPALSPLHGQQPGALGIAVAYGLMTAAALAVTVRWSGGFLNPAVTLMLWVFNRLDTKRMGCFVAVQLAAALAAGACVRFTFDNGVLHDARMGTPHLSALAFKSPPEFATIAAGTAAELALTFFLVFAIFGSQRDGEDPSRVGLPAGLTLTAGAVVLVPLTGAAANPARWLGTVVWELTVKHPEPVNPWTDTFVYLAGPILGALAAGWIAFRYLPAAPATAPAASTSAIAAAPAKPSTAVAKRK